jgi:hypothetical protein
MKLSRADERLKNAKLTLGAVQPKLEPGARIASQLPHAGARRRVGTPVSVVLAKPKPKKAKKNEKPAPQPSPKAPAAGGGPAPVPAIAAGGAAAAAAAKVAAAGLTPVTELTIDPAPAGSVLRTVPKSGEPSPDGTVTLIVSAGFPQVAYDDGDLALVVGGATGEAEPGISAHATVAGRGAWRADGRKIAFVRGGDLFLIRRVRGAHKVRIPVGGRTVEHPSFAPFLRKDVLVFAVPAATPGADADVCWMNVSGGKVQSGPSCRRVNATSIDGFAWSPTGKTLLVAARRGAKFGLLRLATQLPFASDASQWGKGQSFVTPVRDGRGVLAASFSPDGTQVAEVSNLRSDQFTVSIVADDKLDKKPPLMMLLGCDVDWRPDGKELLVVQPGLTCGDGLGSEAVGAIVRVAVSNPSVLTTVVLAGRHPSYQPLDLSPGPAQAPVPGTQP